ncbi:ABC transporter ATP-binding protein [Chloroflexus sp.]|uniref:ABC transporter ATP-binding protein n=1 Tax=Chloroflexus sp. TaxID=1904827 RepID=UPI0026289CC8|nr:ABC transporter ATP-binding protein [uncultured Chloroflexus sp.]
MTAIVETKNLTRYYGEHLALNHLNLHIPTGAVYGFIGPNGAGKTTTMRILTTLLRPSGGEARIAGFSVTNQRAEVRRVVGFMPDSFGFYNNMTAAEYLEFFAAAYHIPSARRSALIDDLLTLVDLGHKRDSDVMSLSRGMKQRLSLARTLIHDPQLLILDEPASGLDPRARVELRELLRELRRLGKTIMISSHILTELAEMCTHIGIIERGTLLASGDVATIMRSLQPHRTFVAHVISDVQTAVTIATAAEHVLAARAITDDGPARIEIDIDGDDHAVSALLTRLVNNGVEIIHFAAQTSNLEEIFLKVTAGVVG